MKRLLLIGMALLFVTACGLNNPVAKSTPQPTPTLTAPDACADKLIKGVLASTTVVPGAFDCAASSEQEVLKKHGLNSDEDFPASSPRNIALNLTPFRP